MLRNMNARRAMTLSAGIENGLVEPDGQGGYRRTDKYVGLSATERMHNLERQVHSELSEMYNEDYQTDLANGKINGVYG